MSDKRDNEFGSLTKKLEAALEGKSEDLANGKLNELEDSLFSEKIKSPNTAVVGFFTTYCPYCRQMNPILEELAQSYKTKVYFAKINVDDLVSLRDRFEIVGVPVVLVFKRGVEVARAEGLQKYRELDDWIDSIHRGLRPMGMESGFSTKAR